MSLSSLYRVLVTLQLASVRPRPSLIAQQVWDTSQFQGPNGIQYCRCPRPDLAPAILGKSFRVDCFVSKTLKKTPDFCFDPERAGGLIFKKSLTNSDNVKRKKTATEPPLPCHAGGMPANPLVCVKHFGEWMVNTVRCFRRFGSVRVFLHEKSFELKNVQSCSFWSTGALSHYTASFAGFRPEGSWK